MASMNGQPTSPRSWASARLVLLAGLALTLAAYLNTLAFGFVYDDHQMGGPREFHLAAVGASFTHHLWAGIAKHGTYYRPVLATWAALLWWLFGSSTALWHASAIATHLAATLLVYLLVAEVGRDKLLAAIAAGIFGVHPIHVEVVAWISVAMSEGFLAVLVLASLWCYVRARHERPALPWFVASWVLCCAAVMTKETALALPLVVLAYEALRPRLERDAAHDIGAGLPATKLSLLKTAVRVAPFAAISALYLVVRHAVIGAPPPQVGSGVPAASASAPSVSIWLTLPSAAWFYLRQLAWPVHISLFQPLTPVAHADFANFWLPIAAIALIAAALILVARRSAIASFGASFLVAMLFIPLVVLNRLPKYELVHDRYLYLPSVGAALLLAVLIRYIAPRLARPAVVLVLAAAACVMVTVSQNMVWTNDLSLYTHAVGVAPESVPALDLLANEMFKRNDPRTALELYQRALRLDPENWATNFSLGVTECQLGLLRDCDRHLEAAARIDEDNPAQFLILAQARMKLSDNDGAAQALERGIRVAPSSPDFHYLLGIVRAQQGDRAAAQEAFAAELQLNPGSAAARRALAEVQQDGR